MLDNKEESDYYFDKLMEHLGHNITLSGYALAKDKSHFYGTMSGVENISVECLDCNVVLIDFDKPEK